MSKVWFGTKNRMQWVPAPLANYSPVAVSWRNVLHFLNGGSEVVESETSHTEVELVWGVQNAEALGPVTTTLQRPGPYFFCDPLAMKTNIVPSYWATQTIDAPPLADGIDPEIVETQDGGKDYSPRALKYVVSGGHKPTNLVIPVPEGHTLHIGVHGSGPGGWRFVGGVGTAATLSAATTQRTNLTYAGPGFAQLEMANGSHIINGIIGQILPTGRTPDSGNFLPGDGVAGLKLRDNPSITKYSSEIENAQMGIAASFTEAGPWS